MPNTPVLVRKGVSAIAGGAHVTKDDSTGPSRSSEPLARRPRERAQHRRVTGLSGHAAYLYLVVER